MNSDLSAIRQAGFRALTRELGAAGAVLFIRQFEKGYGNYTEERDDMLKGIMLEDIVASIQERKNESQLRGES